MTADTESTILSRIIAPDEPTLPPDLARLILQWEFPEADRRRMHVLLDKAKEGTLTAAEKREAETYERVGHFLSLLKSKARVALKGSRLKR
jgi:hypothetical protein